MLTIDMNIINNNTGYLALYLGPMYSGKTSKLLELYKQYTFCNIPTTVINYYEDSRYTNEDMMATHNMEMIPCIKAHSLMETLPPDSQSTSMKVYLVNEGQFFTDIVEWTKTMVEKYNKIVYICGLDGDFQRNLFGDWLNLIPLCNHIEKFTSICKDCAKSNKLEHAIFSYRISSETEQMIIGSDNYIPLCRKCYLSKYMSYTINKTT